MDNALLKLSDIERCIDDTMPADCIDFISDSPPPVRSGRFVEAKDSHGQLVRVGEWVLRPDGKWALRMRLTTPA